MSNNAAHVQPPVLTSEGVLDPPQTRLEKAIPTLNLRPGRKGKCLFEHCNARPIRFKSLIRHLQTEHNNPANPNDGGATLWRLTMRRAGLLGLCTLCRVPVPAIRAHNDAMAHKHPCLAQGCNQHLPTWQAFRRHRRDVHNILVPNVDGGEIYLIAWKDC
ncbi:hypothetical protein QBC41DRAFT_314753 [Cercophora samala]|uniref:C2H2-type domain-containing protein n=1 Tax=Cercophora samala TaxID=330535 RepID=A0AA40DCQ7_9PEZI|nr:hypothetical protein QBC41DRAFT_314753 [Cercophora samala]